MTHVGEVATLLALMAGKFVRAHEDSVVRAVNAKRQVHADAWGEAFALVLAQERADVNTPLTGFRRDRQPLGFEAPARAWGGVGYGTAR